jgi:hypothetical protein
MNLTELLDAYDQVRRKHDLPAMECAAATVTRRLTLAPGPDRGVDEDAWTFLHGLAPQEGWLQFQSHVATFTDSDLPEPMEDWGLLLAAEAALADGGSLVLRPDGRGSLYATLTTPAAGAGTAFLADRVRHRATGRAPGKAINYTRYWQADPERGLVPVIAVFDGFGNPEE